MAKYGKELTSEMAQYGKHWTFWIGPVWEEQDCLKWPSIRRPGQTEMAQYGKDWTFSNGLVWEGLDMWNGQVWELYILKKPVMGRSGQSEMAQYEENRTVWNGPVWEEQYCLK